MALDVKMPICRGCSSIRKSEARPPRDLIRMPIEITSNKIFQNKGIPLFLCEFCDAQEMELALEAHRKRIDNK